MEPGDTEGNPVPVVDRQTGKIVLLFCHNLGDGGETLISQGQAPRLVWMTNRWSNMSRSGRNCG